MPNIQQVTPMLHVPDFTSALDFFTRVLGFSVPFRMANYAYVTRDETAVRVLEMGEESERAPAAIECARMTVYFDVQDVDALYAELKPQLDTLPDGDVQPPGDQHWGQRELHIRMPDGHWLAFGQPIQR